MPSTTTIYNERVKLAVSGFNLVAVGMFAIGVTTPLVSATYGAQVYGVKSILAAMPVLFLWLVSAIIIHLFAQWVLGRMVP
jgi:hypothetical protein